MVIELKIMENTDLSSKNQKKSVYFLEIKDYRIKNVYEHTDLIWKIRKKSAFLNIYS